MNAPKLTAMVAAIAFATAPVMARAEVPRALSAQVGGAPATSQELDVLAHREVSDAELATFEGGEPVVIIGGSVLAVALIILLLVLLLHDKDDGKTVIISD